MIKKMIKKSRHGRNEKFGDLFVDILTTMLILM